MALRPQQFRADFRDMRTETITKYRLELLVSLVALVFRNMVLVSLETLETLDFLDFLGLEILDFLAVLVILVFLVFLDFPDRLGSLESVGPRLLLVLRLFLDL